MDLLIAKPDPVHDSGGKRPHRRKKKEAKASGAKAPALRTCRPAVVVTLSDKARRRPDQPSA